jgi:hypothetical protein
MPGRGRTIGATVSAISAVLAAGSVARSIVAHGVPWR